MEKGKKLSLEHDRGDIYSAILSSTNTYRAAALVFILTEKEMTIFSKKNPVHLRNA